MECRPDLVAKGAQAAFLAFSNVISALFEKNEAYFNDTYFSKLVSGWILFKSVDTHIAKSDWYKNNKGHKAEITTYTVSYICQKLIDNKAELNFLKIWEQQGLTAVQLAIIDQVAQNVLSQIYDTPPNVKNISEYCKKEVCWTKIANSPILTLADLEPFSLDKQTIKQIEKDAKQEGALDLELTFEQKILELMGPRSEEVRLKALELKFMTYNSDLALKKLGRGAYKLSGPEMAALKTLLVKLSDLGYEY